MIQSTFNAEQLLLFKIVLYENKKKNLSAYSYLSEINVDSNFQIHRTQFRLGCPLLAPGTISRRLRLDVCDVEV